MCKEPNKNYPLLSSAWQWGEVSANGLAKRNVSHDKQCVLRHPGHHHPHTGIVCCWQQLRTNNTPQQATATWPMAGGCRSQHYTFFSNRQNPTPLNEAHNKNTPRCDASLEFLTFNAQHCCVQQKD